MSAASGGSGSRSIASAAGSSGGQAFLELGPEQVDARDVTDEERAPAEEVLRIVGTAEVGHQEGDVLRCVTGRRDAADAQAADDDRLAVGEGDVRVADARIRAG